MALTTGENEMRITHMLDKTAEQSLYVFFRIFIDLLKLVKANNTRLIGILQIAEDTFKRIFDLRIRVKLQAELRHHTKRINRHRDRHRLHGSQKLMHKLLPFALQSIKHTTPKSEGKVAQRRGV